DADNHRVQKFDQDGRYFSQFGSSGSEEGQFNTPIGIVIDSFSGNVFVCDNANNRIQKFTANGTFLDQFGGAAGGFGGCHVMTVVFVSDLVHTRIEKWGMDSTATNLVLLSQWGAVGTANGQFTSLGSALAVDASGNVFIPDGIPPYRIQKFTSDGLYVTQW